MTEDERNQLHEQAAQLSYQAIVYDGLSREVHCRDDELAEQMAQKVMVYLRGLLDEERNRIEQAKEKEIVAHE